MNSPATPSPDDVPLVAAPLESFIAAFLRGSGRTPDSYDDSWAGTAYPAALQLEMEGPERALG